MMTSHPLFFQRHFARIFSKKRLFVTIIASLFFSFLMASAWKSGFYSLLIRVISTSMMAMIMFGLLETFPTQLPQWCARWVLQIMGVAFIIPIFLYGFYVLSTDVGSPDFWNDKGRFQGFKTICFMELLFAPWFTLATLVRQKEATVQSQAVAFELERSELERQALDARYRLLQSQIEPHFLFNTLANVRALVNMGSPKAPKLLDSLIAYLRASVPRINDPMPSLEQELQLARSYLELMHMRMPDRLKYTIKVERNGIDEKNVYCPAMCLLSLVENAIRHGIDPSEEGGSIEIFIRLNEEHCFIQVSDTGVGINKNNESLGTGLTSLKERLQLLFQGKVALKLTSLFPHGTKAEITFPLKTELT